MKLTSGDVNVVSNVRFKHKTQVASYSDEHIAKTWRDFSQSEDYPDEEKFLEWLRDFAP